jgi:hypothetical protein
LRCTNFPRHSSTHIHPGQTFDIVYSLTNLFPLQRGLSLQLGLVGYGQYQTTDKTGPNITPAEAAAHYDINALGIASNVILPTRKVSTSFRFFKEFADRSTFQGNLVQISIAIFLEGCEIGADIFITW